MPSAAETIALFLPSYGDGGVERNFVYLANGLAAVGRPVALMAGGSSTVFIDRLRPDVELVRLKGQDDRDLANELKTYLGTHPTAVVMTGQQRDDAIALSVKREGDFGQTRFVLNVGTPLSLQSRESYRFWPKRWWHRRWLKSLFSGCDGVIANSRGVANDLHAFLSVPLDLIAVAPNPAVSPDIHDLVARPVDDPWLSEGAVPVIMGAGRLGRVKDFPTLIRAFAMVRAERPCRLMILGRGRQQAKLERLSASLGVASDVRLTGFVENPYAYLARARLFVVTSRREGGPNVLIEALACGTPVVATDCPHGPREILDDGRYGALVTVGDAEALAAAMLVALREPLPAEVLKRAAEPYTVEHSTARYLQAFGFEAFAGSTPGLASASATPPAAARLGV